MSLTSLRSVILSLFVLYSANRLVIQKMKEEEQWDNVPDEFEVSHLVSLFIYSANRLVIQKMKEEEQWDNVPDEFEVSNFLSLFLFIQLLFFLPFGERVGIEVGYLYRTCRIEFVCLNPRGDWFVKTRLLTFQRPLDDRQQIHIHISIREA